MKDEKKRLLFYDKIHADHLNNCPGSETLRDFGLTIVHPFYNDESRIQWQINNWMTYDEIVKRAVRVNIIDDCSAIPVDSLIPNSIRKRLGLNLKIHRVIKDFKWNTPAALNLGVHTADTDWVMIMDSDCQISNEMLSKLLLEFTPNNDRAYFFMRERITSNPAKKANTYPLTCCILFHKSLFERLGGFDEDFCGFRSGGYGAFDWDFVERLQYSRRYGIFGVIVTENLELGLNVQQKTSVQEDNIKLNKRLWRSKQRGETPRNTSWAAKTGDSGFQWVKTLELERW